MYEAKSTETSATPDFSQMDADYVNSLKAMDAAVLGDFIAHAPDFRLQHPALFNRIIEVGDWKLMHSLFLTLKDAATYLRKVVGAKTVFQRLLSDDIPAEFIQALILPQNDVKTAVAIFQIARSTGALHRLIKKISQEACVNLIKKWHGIIFKGTELSQVIDQIFAKFTTEEAASEPCLRLVNDCIKLANTPHCPWEEHIFNCVMNAVGELGIPLHHPALAETRVLAKQKHANNIDFCGPDKRAFLIACHSAAEIRANEKRTFASKTAKQALCFDNFVKYFQAKYPKVSQYEERATDDNWKRYIARLDRFIALRQLIKETQIEYPAPIPFSHALTASLDRLTPLPVRTILGLTASDDEFNGYVTALKGIPAYVLLARLDEAEEMIRRQAREAGLHPFRILVDKMMASSVAASSSAAALPSTTSTAMESTTYTRVTHG